MSELPPPSTHLAQFNTAHTSGNAQVKNINGPVRIYDSSDSEEDDSGYHDTYKDHRHSPMRPPHEAPSEHPVRNAFEQSPPTAQVVEPALVMPPWIDAQGEPTEYHPEAQVPELGGPNRRGRRHDFPVKAFGQEYRLDIALKETFPSDQGMDAWLKKERGFIKSVIQQVPFALQQEQDVLRYLADVVPNMIYPRLIVYILAHLMDCASSVNILNAFLDTLYRWQSFTSDPIGLLRNAQAIRMTLEMYREHIKSCDDGQMMYAGSVSDTKGLCVMLTRRGTAEAVEACTGLVARSLVNLIQACVDYGSLDMDSKRRLVRILTKLSKSSSEVPKALLLDNVIEGEFIANGGFGAVYKGTWRNQKVAVKIVRANKKSVEQLAKAAAREAVMCRQLVHPNVAPFYGVFRDNNPENLAVWLVSALMDCNLYEFLQNNLEAVQQNNAEHVDCVRLALDIAQGLEYMHEESIIHSDLKSMNILMSTNGRAFLADFGIAKTADTVTRAQTTERTNGTKLWMAPELFDDDPHVHATMASDIYAYGVVCYEMFSGLIPFAGQQMSYAGLPPSVHGKRPPFPQSHNTPAGERGMNVYVWKCIEGCWAQDPKSRPSAKDVVQFYLGEVDPPEDPRDADNIVSPVSKSSDESIVNSFMMW